MKHPEEATWIPFLYGEAEDDVARELEEHLASCPGCRRDLEALRATQRGLDAWRPPPSLRPSPRPVRLPGATVAWAAAAVLAVAVVGFASGRLSAPHSGSVAAPPYAGMEEAIARQVERAQEASMAFAAAQTQRSLASAEESITAALAEHDRSLAAQLVAALEAARQEDRRLTLALVERFSARGEEEVRAVRRDLETVATVADEEIRRLYLKLAQLAPGGESPSGGVAAAPGGEGSPVVP